MRLVSFAVIAALLFLCLPVHAEFETVTQEAADTKGCLTCHEGIESFTEGVMMDTIKAMAAPHGDPGGCVVCHGGNPKASSKDEAHNGAPADLASANGPEMFYPDPGSVWIAEKTCGQCHAGYADRLAKGLMNTEAGKLQGNL